MLTALFRRSGRSAEIYEGAFDAIELEARNPASGLYAFRPDAVVVLNSVQMLRDKFYLRSGTAAAFADAAIGRIVSIWESIQANCSATILQSNLVAPMERWFGNHELQVAESLSSVVSAINAGALAAAANHGNVLSLDVQEIASWVGRKAWFDDRLWSIAKSLCSLDYLPLVAQNIVEVVLTTQGAAVKCVVVDLDNTMWGGVVGDDGPHGIKIGSHGDGEPFYRLQCFLRELKRRGILLAVCSKNDHANAVKPFLENSEMVLKLDDFVAFVANWNNKAQNISVIRDTLNIGFDSMVFLDDNPFERGVVRELIPDVLVAELSEDPAEWIKNLVELNLFESVTVSQEDTRRSELYQQEAARKEAADKAPTFEAFLESLDMRIELSPFSPKNLDRIVQLLQRSNQFNLATRRHNQAQCEAFMRAPANRLAMSVSLKDRFGDHGLISIVIAEIDRATMTLDITDYLMSCRVLSRGVEEYVMNYLFDHAARLQLAMVRGHYVPTAKNGMVKEFYSRFGFTKTKEEENGATEWALPVSAYEKKRVFIREENPEGSQGKPRRIEERWMVSSQTG